VRLPRFSPPDVSARLRSARRRPVWRVAECVLAFNLVGVVCGAALASQLATGVVAQATVLVEPRVGNAFSTQEGSTFVALETEAEVARSDEVLRRVAAHSSPRIGVDELRRRVRARPVSNAEVLVISVRGRTGEQAIQLVRAVGKTTLDVRRERMEAAYAEQATTLQTYATEAERDLARAAGPDGDPSQVATLSRRGTWLRSNLRAVSGSAPSMGAVISSSVASESGPTGRRPGVVAASGALGAAIGLWWAMFRPAGRLRLVSGRVAAPSVTLLPVLDVPAAGSAPTRPSPAVEARLGRP
jgi:hypothetical protein